MPDSTRRGFLKVAGTGAAVAAGAAIAPTPADAAPARGDEIALPASAGGSLVAYVHDVRSGEIAFMVEGHEVSITDHALVARLATAWQHARTATTDRAAASARPS